MRELSLCALVFWRLLSSTLAQTVYEPYAFTTLAGNAAHGTRDGVGTRAKFGAVYCLEADHTGNIYVGDYSRLRRISEDGLVTTVAGQDQDSPSSGQNRIQYIRDIAVNASNEVFIVDGPDQGMIRKLGPDGTLVTMSNLPPAKCIAFDANDNLYVLGLGQIWQFPVGGLPSSALLTNLPSEASDFAVESATNIFMVAAGSLYQFRSGDRTLLAGAPDGPRGINSLAVGRDADRSVYVPDGYEHIVSRIVPSGEISKVTGFNVLQVPDGLSLYACPGLCFQDDLKITVDWKGRIVVSSARGAVFRRELDGNVITLAGSRGGPGYADAKGENARFGAQGTVQGSELLGVTSIAVDASGFAYVTDAANGLRKISPDGQVSTVNQFITFNSTAGVASASDGSMFLYVGVRIYRVLPNGELVTIAGKAGFGYKDGLGDSAMFGRAEQMTFTGLAGITETKSNLYVLDPANAAIRRLQPNGTNWVVSTVNATEISTGKRYDASDLKALASDADGNLYIASGFAIRKLNPAGTNFLASTLAGSIAECGTNDGPGLSARFLLNYNRRDSVTPGIAVDSEGTVYVADLENETIRKITRLGHVRTLAGSSWRTGSEDGIGGAVRFVGPNAIAVDTRGTLYVSDKYNFTVRRGFAAKLIFVAVAAMPNEPLSLNASAPVGVESEIETSNDLRVWTPIWTNTTGGSFSVKLGNPPDGEHRFFRLSVPAVL